MEEPRNRLIALLPAESRERVLARTQRIELAFRQLLSDAGQPIEHVYFPEAGVASVVLHGDNPGAIVEVATIGREGFANTPVLLGVDISPATTFCQIPGVASRIATNDFRDLLDADPIFRRLLLRYTQALINQIAQNASCNRIHNIEERAARWLLMTHDRVDGDTFPLTQEFLGQMLGVRRQAVNVAAGMLQQAGIITYSRGNITILDRTALEEATCECYATIQRDFLQLVGERMAEPARERSGDGKPHHAPRDF